MAERWVSQYPRYSREPTSPRRRLGVFMGLIAVGSVFALMYVSFAQDFPPSARSQSSIPGEAKTSGAAPRSVVHPSVSVPSPMSSALEATPLTAGILAPRTPLVDHLPAIKSNPITTASTGATGTGLNPSPKPTTDTEAHPTAATPTNPTTAAQASPPPSGTTTTTPGGTSTPTATTAPGSIPTTTPTTTTSTTTTPTTNAPTTTTPTTPTTSPPLTVITIPLPTGTVIAIAIPTGL